MRVQTVIALTATLLAAPAFAQQWAADQEIPAAQSKITLKLAGWGPEAIKRATTSAGGENNIHLEVVNSSITAVTQGYYGVVSINEAPGQTTWVQDTIQNIATRFFSKNEPELGEYFDVDHGRADFRALPVRITDNGKKLNCAVFRAYWSQYSSQGALCSLTGNLLAPETVKTFITHIAYKGELAPKGEGTLPTP